MLYMTIMLSIGISNHVLLIPILLGAAKRDAWIGASAAYVPLILWVGAIHVILRKTGSGTGGIAEWLRQRYGNTARVLIASVMAMYMFAAGLVSVADTAIWTKTAYLPFTPKSIIVFIFMLLCFLGALAGIRAIAIASGILLPGVVVLGYFVAAANLQYKDYTLLTPLFTHGYAPAARAMAYTAGGLFELLLIPFVKHHVSSEIRTRGLLLLGLINVVLTVGPLTGSISIFGPFEAAEQRYPAFEQWRMVTVGKFISHLDFFSIYQWLSGSFIRISFMLFLIPDLLGIEKSAKRNSILAGCAAGIAVLASLPFSDVTLLSALSRWYFPGAAVVNAGVGLALLVLTLLPAARRGEKP